MKLVVVGKGGREHALAKKLLQSPSATQLWVCPGNAGMEQDGLQCLPYETPAAIEEFCVAEGISLVVVGPEMLILSDLKKRLEERGIYCFAPDAEVAELEASKLFCKGILKEAGVATAACTLTYSAADALAALEKHDFKKPIVVKADGLAQGKGVWVCDTKIKAQEAVQTLGSFFGFPLLLEECLEGPELSAFALCDGEDFVLLGTACDYKRISQDPFSANTGGMGAYSPCDFINSEDEKVIHDIFKKTLQCLHRKDLSYQGFLFAGLVKTANGLYVLEYNVRMGDPETQALMPRIKSDLLLLIVAAVTHELKGKSCQLSEDIAVHVVATSQGYPGSPMSLGHMITNNRSKESQTHLYFAGVNKDPQGLVNVGGRVLGVTALGSSKEIARSKAYSDLKKVNFEGMYFREDIAQ